MKGKLARDADFGPPGQISQDDFEAICRDSHIPNASRADLREILDEAIEGFGLSISRQRGLPSRQYDSKTFDSAIKAIRKAQHFMKNKPGLAGQQGLRTAARQIGSIVSASWMRDRFPNDGLTPSPRFWPVDDYDLREPSRWAIPDRSTELDDLSLNERVGFMRAKGSVAIAALLEDIAAALEAGRGAILRLPSGRKPMETRKYMLAGLANVWNQLGRTPTTGSKSKFGEFCESVFDAIGWPTDGVNAALEEAIKLWSNLYRASGENRVR